MRTALITVIFALFTHQVHAQTESIGPPIRFDAAHNASTIAGTWSSGSQHVQTGPGFANPIDSTFTYPATPGIGYSFSNDGFFEEALYRFTGNGTDPRCIVGVVQFQHGKYELLANGSIVLDPFAPDGRQQIQNPCAAQSNILRQFNQTTLFQSWRIFVDPQGRDKLHLFRFDGAPFPPMFRVSETPTMLPQRVLTNTTIGTTAEKRDLKERSAGAVTHPLTVAGFSAASLVSLGLLSLF
ncbi:hypothetical protein M408DRAFT_328704 [Serendipita vermifera MAFF 305830]|uniref:Protein ROT1 n=1 Tax=Serendipita vermifera MAFF 305830 TaxID=933852 RepID=A0A0C2XK49_SERVB|nr:hypothetical protein M408DRAFT_328704 [Serendipita vermifera MAFF 305830]